MAVISELIDVGMSLKEQKNYQAAIEHFRQLNVTYPEHARIMFELAGAWQSFGVPEQALPLYRQLMAMPRSQGLPAKDVPRLYTQMGAALRLIGNYVESLAIIEEGLSRYPDYRPLKAYHMFALHSAGYHQNAMIEALQLMLESLAPTKWDLYEDDVFAIVADLRERIPQAKTDMLADWEFDEFWSEDGKSVKPKVAEVEEDEADEQDEDEQDATTDELSEETDATDEDSVGIMVMLEDEDSQATDANTIPVDSAPTDSDNFEIKVKVVNKKDDKATSAAKRLSDAPKSKGKATQTQGQLGKKPVKIDINANDDEANIKPEQTSKPKSKRKSADDDKPSASGKIHIPVDSDD